MIDINVESTFPFLLFQILNTILIILVLYILVKIVKKLNK